MTPRASAALVALALATMMLVSWPASANHPAEGGVSHLEVLEGTLDAGASWTTNVSFGGAPLEEGWLVLVNGYTNGSLQLELQPVHSNDSLAWSWQGSGLQMDTGRLPATDWYRLRVHNTGSEAASYQLYFDQTCDCVGKAIPLADGYAWFNWDMEAGESLDVAVQILETAPFGQQAVPPERVEVEATIVEPLDGGWPDGFVRGESVRAEEGPLLLTLHAEEAGTHYVLLQAIYDLPQDSPGWLVQLRPVITEVAAQEAPGVAPMAVLVAVASLMWRRLRAS